MFAITRRISSVISSNCNLVRNFQVATSCYTKEIQPETTISIPDYKIPVSENPDVKRARLLYQSRKRGMLENDLLLGTFVDKYLFDWNSELLMQYDRLINCPYSDWDIYYWAVGTRPIPPEYNNEVMALLQQHVKNKSKERRIRQPDLPLRAMNKQ